MPALNFSPQFATAVKKWTKRCTIRATRKRPIKVGDKLYLYTGMRTKQCRKLGEAVCSRARPIIISFGDFFTSVQLDGKYLRFAEVDRLAALDGFSDTGKFYSWFLKRRDRFEGQLIEWEKPCTPEA